MDAVVERAVADARSVAGGGMDGVIVENFGDAPFHPAQAAAETIAAMTRAVLAVREAVTLPVGVNVLRNDPIAALGVAAACGAAFIRVNVHVGAAWTDQGLVVGRAHETLRARARLSPGVRILADIAVKHATPVAPRPIAEEAKECLERGRADAIIITGAATGSPVDFDALVTVREALPEAAVFVGSGVGPDNVTELLRVADGAIVGTAVKLDGVVTSPVDPRRVREIVERARAVRRTGS
jgi:membrane complex biogenesis BtpA family protein